MGEKRKRSFLRALREWLRGASRPDVARREEGLAILIVVLMTFIVTALGATIVVMSNTNHLIAAHERDSERALYASKAGLEYGYHLFTKGAVPAGATGTSFDSFAPAVGRPLDGASFQGVISYLSSSRNLGQVFRIQSTGTYHNSLRTTEAVVQVVPDPFRYGFLAFDEVHLHNHSHLSGATFKIDSTMFSNGDIEVQPDIALDGTVVSGGHVDVLSGSTLNRDVFANSVFNAGEVKGNVKTLAAVDALPDNASAYDRTDSHGKKYGWYNGKSSAGGVTGSGSIRGTRTSYTVKNGDDFKYAIFRKDGKIVADPDLNVVKYVPPPELDYQAMKREADKYEPTYFTSMTAAMSYLASKKVTETIAGKAVTTIRVGTDTFPELLYVVGDFKLKLDPAAAADNPAQGILKADGFNLEGGIYATGNVSFNGPAFDRTIHPAPPDWYQFRINSLPYCYPSIIAYQQPTSGSVATWTPADTPIMNGSGSGIEMSSSASASHEGFISINGVTYSQAETHLHHTKATDELIRFNGAELAYTIHSCDYMWFSYDPEVRCTNFLLSDSGSPQVVSYREIR